MSFFEDVNIEWQNTGNIDAFGRARVSQLSTQIDIKQIHDNQPILIDQVQIGGGSETYSSATSSTELEVTNNQDAAISQTKQRFNYQSGKSQLIYWTFYGFNNQADTTKRVGYFSSNTSTPFNSDLDGIFLESDGTDISVNTYRAGTQTSRVTRSNWDDPLDGSGKSEITHDFDNNTIFAVDFEWLGVGRVRYYIVKGGAFILFHETDFTDTTNVYMQTPNQPLRWEARASGSTGGTGFTYICASVNSEGAINEIGKVLSDNTGTNDLQLNTSGTTYAAGSMRLKTDKLDGVVDILNFDYLAETNDRALWEIRLNPTVTGTFAYSDVANSAVQTAFGNQTGGASPTVSGGTILDSGYVERNGSRTIQLETKIILGAQIDGTRDEIVICVTPINSGLDAYVSLTWRELV